MRRSACAPALAIGWLALVALPAGAHASAQVQLGPAAGAARSTLSLKGTGFAPSRTVTVSVTGLRRRTATASRSGAFTLRLTVPRGHRRLTVTTGGRSLRVVNRFVVVRGRTAASVVEVSSSRGGRVRITPGRLDPGGTVRAIGSGFAARRQVHVSYAAVSTRVRTDSRGRFDAVLALPGSISRPLSRLIVSGGGNRLAATLGLGAAVTRPGDASPGVAVPAGGDAPVTATAGSVTGGAADPPPEPEPDPQPLPGSGPVNTVAPSVDGSAALSATLTARPGTWQSAAKVIYSYQWQRCSPTGLPCLDLPGQTRATYFVTAADVGRRLRVDVSATNSVGTNSAHSGFTSRVGDTPAGDVGYADFSYGTSVSAPTGQKPQSKLWHTAGGQWWGVLWSTGAKAWTIHKFNAATQAWSSTGVKVDTRPKAGPDALYSAGNSTLYVVTAWREDRPPSATDSYDPRILVTRFSFDGSSYAQIGSASTVPLADGAPETIAMDRDSAGTLWLTYTRYNAGTTGPKSVMVAHTTTGEATWSAPAVLPVASADNLDADDISTIVTYGSGTRYTGVLWSNEADDTLNFARHVDGAGDGTWQRIVLASGDLLPDDHLNVKALLDDGSGRVFAVVKTSLNDAPAPLTSAPLIELYTISGTSVSKDTVWRVGDDVTRANVLLDTTNRRVHVFGAGPCCSGGTVYHKSSSYDDPRFASGLGTPFIRLAAHALVNNVTTTKQTVDATTGLLIEAGDDATRTYVHNHIDLVG